MLTEGGRAVTTVPTSAAALALARNQPPDVILCSLRSADQECLSFLRSYRAEGGTVPVIMTEAAEGDQTALAASREGAYDCLRSPLRGHELQQALRRAEERERLRREVSALRNALGSTAAAELIVAESRVTRELLDAAARVARAETPVLITGESGTGRKTLAHAIHRMSSRSSAPFVTVSCTVLPERLLEDALFGDSAGASPEGTLLIDAIGQLPPRLQDRLIEMVQPVVRETTRRPRIIVSDLEPLQMVAARGQFRRDLSSLLSAVHFHLPPLRERPEEIPALVTHFLGQASARLGHPVSLTPQAMSMLIEEPWPGNVRQLRNAVDGAVLLSGSGRLDSADFLPHLVRVPGSTPPANNGAALAPLLDKVERDAILRALDLAKGSRREAARLLGVSLRTLFYKLRRHRLDNGKLSVG